MLRTDFQKLCKIRYAEAKALYNKRHYDGAAYLIGYSIEMALKARVCKILESEYPLSGKFSSAYKTHEFDILIRLSGLKKKYEDKVAASADFQRNYALVNGWSEDWRYQSGVKSKADVEALMNAMEDRTNGVLTWIKKLW